MPRLTVRSVSATLLLSLAVPTLALLSGCGDARSSAAGGRPFAWPPGQPVPATAEEPDGPGLPVTLDSAPGAAWAAVQAAPAGVERDRAAIRALAGDYRVTFDFQETVTLRPDGHLAAPYHSWATERVFIIADTPGRISLQHQLVIRGPDQPREAMVVKHWREDWTWQDRAILAFKGLGAWRNEPRDAEAASGTWSQSVWGVADEPRFEAAGRWRHDGQTSQWVSERGLRPLPRREATKRKDYQALDGIHRITITPTGWVQWQDNFKLPLAAPGQPVAEGPLAIEIGCTRYERITGFDWTPGVAQWNAEAAYWDTVRAAWDGAITAAGNAQIERAALAAGIEKQVGEPPAGAVPGAPATR